MKKINVESMKIGTAVFLLMGVSLGPSQVVAGGKIVGSGETIAVTDNSVTLEGWFSGIIIGADRVHVNMKAAVVDCGGVIDSIGVDLGPYSRVHINGGTIENCGVGIMAGARSLPLTPVAGSNNRINGVTIKDGLGSASCCFGDAIAINGGTNNRIINNQISNYRFAGIRIFHGSDNDVTGNVIRSFFGSDNTHGGILIQDADSTTVHGNDVSTGGGTIGIHVLTAEFGTSNTIVSGNSAFGNTVDLVDDSADCGTSRWTGNQFATDGGPKRMGRVLAVSNDLLRFG